MRKRSTMKTQPLAGQLAERVRSREIAEAHFVAELSNDPDEILKSMKSYEPLLTTVVVSGATGTPNVVRCATPDEQRAFYAASRAQAHMIGVDIFTSIGSDWYGFVHGVVTSEEVATSQRFVSELVGLLPSTADEHTVAGEIGLGWPLGFGKLGDAPGEVALERVATLRAHDAWLNALRVGDPQRIGDLYAEDARVAMRHPVTGEITCIEGREAIVSYYGRLVTHARVCAVDVVLRVVDRWFVFTELAVRLHHDSSGDVTTRLADVCVMGKDDKIRVHLGTSAGPAADYR
jgi:hypothetical protein